MIDYEMELAEIDAALRNADRALMHLYRANDEMIRMMRWNALNWIANELDSFSSNEKRLTNAYAEIALAIEALNPFSQELGNLYAIGLARDISIVDMIDLTNYMSFDQDQTSEKIQNAIGSVEAAERALKKRQIELTEIWDRI